MALGIVPADAVQPAVSAPAALVNPDVVDFVDQFLPSEASYVVQNVVIDGR